jgi:hypothetical protein
MKLILTLIIIFSLMIPCLGQEINPLQKLEFKSSSFFVVFLDKYKNFEVSSQEQTVEHKILYTPNKILISGTNERSFVLTSKSEKWIEGSTVFYKWKATDQNNKKVYVRMMVTIKGDPNNYRSILYIDYADQTAVFFLVVDK